MNKEQIIILLIGITFFGIGLLIIGYSFVKKAKKDLEELETKYKDYD